ncbi:MAG: STAS domain-containing protein [Candidatus Atribacteria bacterium]|nr:STAS domain-containing protein [Candidatus Atribacteria bacterium]MBE3126927.1 STAS domain-containing protein [Candidatus Atribacteria bacterium]MBE3141671.1 STAS domain-containing protein [Thermoplasmata archaeon]
MQKVPILKVGDTLIISLQVELHDKIVLKVQEDILQKVYETSAGGLIIDMSAIEVIDSFMGKILSETAAMARIMGAETVLVGIQPEIAITLQELGLKLKGVHTTLDLEEGMKLLQNIREVRNGEE